MVTTFIRDVNRNEVLLQVKAKRFVSRSDKLTCLKQSTIKVPYALPSNYFWIYVSFHVYLFDSKIDPVTSLWLLFFAFFRIIFFFCNAFSHQIFHRLFTFPYAFLSTHSFFVLILNKGCSSRSCSEILLPS